VGERILFNAIAAPYETILSNASIEKNGELAEGNGINVITGEEVDMVKAGIIDPVLVTKTALKNSISVVTTIISADCVISNIRVDEGS
jgi:chaperonin GroEL